MIIDHADTYCLARAGVMQMARLQGSQDPLGGGGGEGRGGKCMLVNWGCSYFRYVRLFGV